MWQRLLLSVLVLLSTACDELVTEFEYSSVEVEAVRRNGEPVPGIELQLYTGNRVMEYGTTDARGQYTFEFVPFGNYGVSTLLPPDFSSMEGERFVYVDNIQMGHGELSEIGFLLLKRGPGSITARVVDEQGDPVEGTEVTLYHYAGDLTTAQTTADGSVRFDPVEFGEYGVYVTPPVGFAGRTNGQRDYEDGILIDEGYEAELSFTIRPCRGEIRVDVRGDAGSGAERVRVVLYTSAGEVARGVTGPNGRFVFADLPCGGYGVRLERSPGWTFQTGRTTSFVDGLEFWDHAATLDVSFDVTACKGTIVVRVEDSSGRAVGGARLVLYGPGEEFDEQVTDASGVATFADAPCGSLGVRLEPPTGYSTTTGSGGSHIDGIEMENGAAHEVDFTVIPG